MRKVDRIMNQLEFKKFPVLATVLAVISLVLSVVAITWSLGSAFFFEGSLYLGLLLLVASVLFVAGLTTGRIMLLRVISIITSSGVIVANFFITIAKYGIGEKWLFAFALLMLIASVLCFVYYLSMKSERIKKMYYIATLALVGLTFVYTVLYIIRDLGMYFSMQQEEIMFAYYFVLLGYVVIVSLPMVIYYSLSKKEQQEEAPKEESKEQE